MDKAKKSGRPPSRPIVKPALMKAIKMVGGNTQLGTILGISNSKISDWLYTNEKIPAHHVPKIVVATNGKIRPEALRADIQWDIPKAPR